jgi:hypothetical protein
MLIRLLLLIARFKSGLALSWSLFGGAVDEDSPDSINQTAGTAYDTEAYYFVFKDAGNWLYSTDEGSCNAMHYVF